MSDEQPGIQLQPLGLQSASHGYSTTFDGSSTNPSRPKSQEFVGDSTTGLSPSPEELAALALPPIDRGFKAWSFVAAAFTLETLVWGFGFTYGVFQEYFLHHRTFGDASEAAIGAVGTVALAIEYFEVLVVILVAQQWPDK
ncbi:hypothetical protein FRC09_019034, partial [Ceratobasidium sp. 395]